MANLKSITLLNYFGTGYNLKLGLSNEGLAFVKPGDTRAITGPNGYGKSLILDAINTLLYPGEHLPKAIHHFADKIILKGDSGKITWEYNGGRRKSTVTREGIMPTAVFVGEDTTYSPIIDGPVTEKEHEFIKKYFGEYLYPKNASEYSKGFKRFVKIIRAAKEAQETGSVLLIDTPESNLHMFILLSFCQILRKLQRQQVIVTTHNPRMFDDDFTRSVDLYECLEHAKKTQGKDKETDVSD